MEDFDLSIPYGIHLDDDGQSDMGNMTCLSEGTYIGNLNGSFLIEEPYGRSYPEKDVLRVFADNSIAMFQSYACKSSLCTYSTVETAIICMYMCV